jgi:cytoskeletal protein CcmA (bactofilin family)
MAIFGKTGGPPSQGLAARGENAPGASFIGPATRFRGELQGDEDVLVEGRIEGSVKVSKAFRVAAEGVVTAEVAARTIWIAGRVVGNVTAEERVEILPTGILEGNIRAPRIVIGEGARFTGRIDMSGHGESLPPSR